MLNKYILNDEWEIYLFYEGVYFGKQDQCMVFKRSKIIYIHMYPLLIILRYILHISSCPYEIVGITNNNWPFQCMGA